jgi:inner membrane protein
MTAPTHIAFSLATALLFGAEGSTVLGLAAGGALLPDIDHPQSAIGRVFFFFSIPLNKYFGHRGFIHSVILWLPLTILGSLFFKPMLYLGMGALSHCLLDCLNISGVALLKPVTEKIFVLASQRYRIGTGSRQEFILMMALGFVGWGGGYIGSQGGIRTMLQAFMGNYQMAVDRYKREGTKQCYFEGKLRLSDGNIKEGSWLVIGTEGSGPFTPVAVYDREENKIIHIPDQAEFLKAKIKVTEKDWHTLKLSGPSQLTKGTVYFKPGNKWHIAKEGEFVFGVLQYEGDVTLKPSAL